MFLDSKEIFSQFKNMKIFSFYFLPLFFIISLWSAPKSFQGTYTSIKDPQIPEDFKFQGEYSNNNFGAQVIGLDKGAFHVVLYKGGLPGAGWDGENRSLLDGKLIGSEVKLTPAIGKRKYLAQSADQFSATREFPPKVICPITDQYNQVNYSSKRMKKVMS